MIDNIQERKAALRRQLRSRLRAVTPEIRRQAAERAMALLLARPEWRRAASIMIFAPLPDELDLWPLAVRVLEENRHLALPRFDPETSCYHAARVSDPSQDVAPGSFGIREPRAGLPEVPLNQLDFVLVPGLGFDFAGRRLGRGKGYYDRLLTAIRGTACGVAMDGQMLPSIPAEPHDKNVDCILTPTCWLAVARRTSQT
jgi:5-formyltetrahydrofolate cyclo-ligase